MTRRKSKKELYEIEELGDISLSPELDQEVREFEALEEAEIESTRVNFRWQREPLELVKAVASAMGIPYQTYMKHVLYRQASEDFAKIQTTRDALSRSNGAVRETFDDDDDGR